MKPQANINHLVTQRNRYCTEPLQVANYSGLSAIIVSTDPKGY